MKKNNLPDNWLVYNDGSQLFKDTVIAYLNDEFNVDLLGLSIYYGIVDSNLIATTYTNLECVLSLKEFIELSKPINMIDFKVKGTKLPIIPPGIEYRRPTWNSTTPNAKSYILQNNFVSYGHTTYNKEIYILAEDASYFLKVFYMIRESDIIQLAKEQEMFKNNTMEKKIIGYKCPMDLFGGKVKKGDIFRLKNVLNYSSLPENSASLSYYYELPREIVETWEPIYELQEPYIEVNGYKAKFEEGKIKFGCASFHINVFRVLNSLIKDIDNENCYIGQNTSKNIENVTLGKGTFTRDQIKQIVEYYDAKFTE